MNPNLSSEINTILRFLTSIGIPFHEKKLEDNTFLPGLHISSNGIEIDVAKLRYPGDILHEAGHWAVTPAIQRSLIDTPKMPEEWPTQGDEIAAMLWSYAALTHLNLPANYVFHEQGYKGQSEWFIENYSQGNYIGLPLLQWMGLAFAEQEENIKQGNIFPKMNQWLRD
ncbi:hypothetical protein [Flavobacterium sp.]|uniref:hypothetical protein n=1 Tax=Flavobacterium sp. TaxID=239 RepID=UPI003D1228B8